MQRKRLVSLEQASFELSRKDAGASSKIIDKRLLWRVIADNLTPIQREYLSDYFFNHMTMQDVADAHGVTRSTVSRTIKRAKFRIKEALKYSIMD